jgi:Zn-finger nucleic acid-binding protein
LVEIDRGDIKIDICVNEDCGAVHLDPGELEQILKDKKAVFAIRKSLFAVFKK